jgi:predicted RNA polymerase sigma factor
MRAALCDKALRLGRMLVQLLPGESEVHALLALMELNASTRCALRLAGETTVRRFCCQTRIAPCGTTCRFNEE